MTVPLVGAIEAGGTKFVCAVGTGPGQQLLARTQFATGDQPQVVLTQVTTWLLEQQQRLGRLDALGIASFGPVDLDENSPTWGFLTTTPKLPWQHTDLIGPLRRSFPESRIGFDTDVNGAALGEARWGAATGLTDVVYVTVGTGIGGGGLARGKLLHGLIHPEMGHMGLPRPADDLFEGACPFHGRCWEGLCSGPAILRRTGIPAEELPVNHPAWDQIIRYMAHALANLTYVLSPQRIILGGSVRKAGRMGEDEFFRRLRLTFREIVNGYLISPSMTELGINQFLVPPQLGDDAGVCGAIALAHDALADA